MNLIYYYIDIYILKFYIFDLVVVEPFNCFVFNFIYLSVWKKNIFQILINAR